MMRLMKILSVDNKIVHEEVCTENIYIAGIDKNRLFLSDQSINIAVSRGE